MTCVLVNDFSEAMNYTEFDVSMMRRALQLAMSGRGFVSPNPMVGAVIVNESGMIVGEGWHRRFGEAHAEVNAVSMAKDNGADLGSCDIYVTLEPCAHFGKTPPCARLLAECGFRKVIVGCADPFPEVSGRGIALLRDAGIEVVCDVLRGECEKLNERFFFAHRHRRPWVELKWAQSSDGYMAGAGGKAATYSTAVTKTLMHKERSGFDAILAGTGTIVCDDPALTVRLWPHRRLRPVVLGSTHLPGDAQVLSNPDLILADSSVPLGVMLAKLYEDHGVTSLMVEGGARLLSSFMADNSLWQEARVEIATYVQRGGLKAPEIPPGDCSISVIDGNTIMRIANAGVTVNER